MDSHGWIKDIGHARRIPCAGFILDAEQRLHVDVIHSYPPNKPLKDKPRSNS